MYIAKYDANGKYLQIASKTVPQPGIPAPPVDPRLPGEMGAYEGLVDVKNQYHDIVSNQPVNIPEKPEGVWEFDYITKQWADLRTLDKLRSDQWLIIKTARESAVDAGFTWDGSKFDSDQVSQARIQGAVSLANMDPGFSITWTLFDNTFRTLSASEMIAVGVALGVHVQTQFDKARGLRDQIDAATTREAVLAVVW